MSRRELLMRACEDSDYQALRELGWLQIYEALRDWWARKFPPHELKPYCDLLGQEEPGAVMVSVRNCIDYEWRPTPSTARSGRPARTGSGARSVRTRAPRPSREFGGFYPKGETKYANVYLGQTRCG
jgi:hypothetical protein